MNVSLRRHVGSLADLMTPQAEHKGTFKHAHQISSVIFASLCSLNQLQWLSLYTLSRKKNISIPELIHLYAGK